MARLGAERLTRVHLELGGNAPVVVFADADPVATAEAVAGAAFFNAGQDCTAATRVLVERGAHDALVAALADEATAAVTGDPYDEDTVFGPLVSADHLAKVVGLLGATAVAGRRGGRRQGGGPAGVLPRGDRGHRAWSRMTRSSRRRSSDRSSPSRPSTPRRRRWPWPTGSPRASRRACGRRTPAGRRRLLAGLEFGAVSVNTHAPMTAEMPHGGFRTSGYGKDLSLYGLEDYTRIKHVATAW